MRLTKLLHMSDLHLGRPFGQLPPQKAQDLREAQLMAFGNALRLAESEAVDAILIVGDLFDSNGVSSRWVKRVQERIASCAIPCYLLPGAGGDELSGHDSLSRLSVYWRDSWDQLDNLFLFREEQSFYLPSADLALYARPSLPGYPVLPQLPRHPEARFHVGLCHASVRWREEIADYPLEYAEIANSNFDYLALGHWHKRQEHSKGGVTAWYSGTPETLEWERDVQGGVLLVSLDAPGHVRVEERLVGTYHWVVKNMTLSGDESGGELQAVLEDVPLERCLLRLALRGKPSTAIEDSLSVLGPRLFHLQLDQSQLQEIDWQSRVQSGTVGEAYLQWLAERLRCSQDQEEQRALRQAMDLGLRLLTGEATLKDLDLEEIC